MYYPIFVARKKLAALFSSVFVAFIVTTASGFGYTYPIGIPEAWVAPDVARPARPSPWTSDTSGYYYVDASVGTDTGRTYGNPTAPRKTIPRPVPAGGYVEVHGTYDVVSAGQCWIQGAGTSAKPVWVVGLDAASRPTFSAGTLVYGSYVYVEYILWTQKCQIGSTAAGFPVDHIMVRHSECTGTGKETATRSGFTSQGSTANPAQYVLFYDDKSHDMGDLTSLADLDCLAFTTAENLTHAWVLDCEWYNMLGGTRAGSAVIGADSSLCRFIYWGRNYGHDGRQNALAVKYAKDVVFSQNICARITDNGNGLSPGKGIAAQYGPDGLWIIFNRILDCGIYGISFGTGDSSGAPWQVYVIGNVITGIGAGQTSNGSAYTTGGIAMRNGYTHYVVGNTIVNCSQGYISGSGADFHYIENNIFGPLTDPTGAQVNIEIVTNTTMRNNLLYTSSGAKIKWGSTLYNSLAAFQSGTSKGQNCVEKDPLLKPDSYSFDSSSPAVDVGLTDTELSTDLYALFETTFAVDIRKDFDGKSRPSGNGWDIGAYEAALDGSGPNAPVGLHVFP
jgi:hypothetical protein